MLVETLRMKTCLAKNYSRQAGFVFAFCMYFDIDILTMVC